MSPGALAALIGAVVAIFTFLAVFVTIFAVALHWFERP